MIHADFQCCCETYVIGHERLPHHGLQARVQADNSSVWVESNFCGEHPVSDLCVVVKKRQAKVDSSIFNLL